MSNYIDLKDRHNHCVAYIVGKGPSLKYLSSDYFNKEWAIVIALNDTISIVQELGLTLPIYSLQKDGYSEFMIEPHSNIPLILQKDYASEVYYPNHSERYLVHPVNDLDFNHTGTLAIRMAISIAKYMGCTRIIPICCDNLSNAKELRTYSIQGRMAGKTTAAQWYKQSRLDILDDLKSIPHDFIIPA